MTKRMCDAGCGREATTHFKSVNGWHWTCEEVECVKEVSLPKKDDTDDADPPG